MWLFSVPSIRNSVLLAALSLVFALGSSSAYPIINSNHREGLSPRGILKKESSWTSTRTAMNYASGPVRKKIMDLNKFAIENPMRVNVNPEEGQNSSAPVSEVVPKDPNSFFHPASISQFKSSVASFKAWQHLHFFPDTHRLAHDKAQDVAAEIDHFIEEFSNGVQSHRMAQNPNSNL